MTHVVVGPRRHGVVEFGLALAEAMRPNGFGAVSHVGDPSLIPAALPPGIHLQFTDRLFGTTPATAAEAVGDLVGRATAGGVRVTATLHDVPQPSDGEHFDDRVDAYAAVCAMLHGVVANSDHERILLCESGISPRRLATVPLPMRAVPSDPVVNVRPSVGVFGFLYPGKGHLEVLTALGDLDPGVDMVAIGEPSAGHEHLTDDLRDLGRRQGRSVTVTGHVPDGRLCGALREVTVPIAHHRHVSASGSLNTWLAAGRRPLTVANRYTVEMSDRNPEAFVLYDDDESALRNAIRRALADPMLTWLPAGTTVTPTAADAADQYDRLLRQWHR